MGEAKRADDAVFENFHPSAAHFTIDILSSFYGKAHSPLLKVK